jgi:ATP adenylyltransferase
MKEIRTPWRMRYITATERKSACIFCSPLCAPSAGGETCRERLVLHQGTTAFVILNLYPYTTGHLMVVPYRHLPRFGDLTTAERAELAGLLRRSERILRAVTGARRFHAGINLGRAAGAGVEGHLHAHLVPRDARREWADTPGAEEPALPVEEAFRRLAPHFIAGAGTAF